MKRELLELNQEDRNIFLEIEKVRQNIIKMNIEFEMIDYGAGDPTSKRTEKTMNNGVKRSTSTKEMCSFGIKQKEAEFIYRLIKTNKPKKILELGTCCGFSSIYMAMASPKSLIYTIEGDKELAKIAGINIKKFNLKNVVQEIGKFKNVLPPFLNSIGEIDFVFIDGHHDKGATIQYFNQIKKNISNDGIMVFDDILWSEPMKLAWSEIIKDKDIKEYEDLTKLGICYM